MAVVDRWSLFGGHLCNKCSKWDLKMMVVIDRWSLFGGGRLLRFDCILKCSFNDNRFNEQRKFFDTNGER